MTKFSLYVTLFDNRTLMQPETRQWIIPEDTEFYRKAVRDKPVLMGHTTFKVGARPLIGPTNFVLSKDSDLVLQGAIGVTSAAHIFHWLKEPEEVVIVGGHSVFSQCLDDVSTIYMMRIHREWAGQEFPTLTGANWDAEGSLEGFTDDVIPNDYTFTKYIKR